VLPTPDLERDTLGIRHEAVPAPDADAHHAANLAYALAEMGPAT
jgi:hypothetical protein